MKVSVKTLNGNQFDIEVHPTDNVLNVKKQIEQFKGSGTYPSEQQLLIYKGKVLNDENTIKEINVVEDSFLVVMLYKKPRHLQSKSRHLFPQVQHRNRYYRCKLLALSFHLRLCNP